MGKYVKTLTLNKEPAQVEERIRHFLTTYGFVSAKDGDWFEKGKGFWEAKRKFAYRYEDGVLTYEAWLNKGLDPSDGKYQGSMIKKAYMAELASFDEFIMGNTSSLPEVTYSPKGTYAGLGITAAAILICIFANLVSLWLPFASLVVTIPNGPKSKAKVLAWIVIGLDMLIIIYWILSVCLNFMLLGR